MLLQLIDLLDDFGRACSAGDLQHALDILFPVLLSHVKARFAQEERMMCMISGYDDFEWIHLAQHRDLLIKLEHLHSQQNGLGLRRAAEKINHCLQHILMFHFSTSDRELAHRLLQQPIANEMH